MLRVLNKIDLSGPRAEAQEPTVDIRISAKTGAGIEVLVAMLREAAGLEQGFQGAFSARTRHLDALRQVAGHLDEGRRQLQAFASAELLAEELRLAQAALGEITGTVLPDDLLGAIFSSFCIGK